MGLLERRQGAGVQRGDLDRRAFLQRLDGDASPVSLVERAGDGVDTGVVRAHVDVPTLLDVPESPPEDNIFRVLGVRDDDGAVTPCIEVALALIARG